METAYVGTVMPLTGKGAQDAEVLVIDDGRISQVGSDSVSSAEVFDFGDRVIMPGFCDPHTHAEVASIALGTMSDCRAPGVKSISDIQNVLRNDLHLADESGWLVGQGNLFLDQKLAERRMPTREELDQVSTDVAIAIRAGGHTTVLNSRALELTGFDVTDPTESFMGPAIVERDAGGRTIGQISELDSQLPVPELSPDKLREHLIAGVNDLYVKHGVTTVGEISETLAGTQALIDATATGDIPVRLSLNLWAPGTMPLEDALDWRKHLRVPEDHERISVDGIKIFTDGGFSGRTAALITPYLEEFALEPHSFGELAMTPERLRDWLRRILDAGFNPIVHTCGERSALLLAQTLIEMGLGRDSGVKIRAEHSPNYIAELGTIQAWIDAGIQPVGNPSFIQANALFLPDYIGEPALTGRYNYRRVLDSGIEMSCASDMHMGGDPRQTNPFFGIWCAVTRHGFWGDLVEPEQAVTVEEALLMHTRYAAADMGYAGRRGALIPGADADFIVLDRDPRSIPAEELLDVQVDYVYVGGKEIYRRPGAEAITVR